MWVLGCVGVDFEDADAAALFARHGAKTDGARVFIGEALLKDALSSAVKSFTVHGFSSAAKIGGAGPVMSGPSNAASILRGGRAVTPTAADFIDTLRLNDTSKVMTLVNSQHIYASGIPAADSPAVKTALALRYSGKPVITYCSTYGESASSLSVAGKFYGYPGHYYAVGVGNMVSPLRYTRESIGAINAYAEFGQPIVLACCSAMGMTSPVTVGGTLVQNNAEVLAGIIYTHLKSPGLPVVYGNVSGTVDMRYVTNCTGAFEAAALIPYISALGEFYGLPVRAGGACSDAHGPDYQAGAESAVLIAATLSRGVDFAMHMGGEINGYNTYSMEKQILDEETIERFAYLNNMDFFPDFGEDAETIREVGPGGHFLTEPQTLERYKDCAYMPRISNKAAYAVWESAGARPLEIQAADEVRRRLESHEKPRLTPEQLKLTGEICGTYDVDVAV
jgi:trimethylamine--corrinoid protein Co-methyltransferase